MGPMSPTYFSAKHLGFVLIAVAVLLAGIFFSITNQIMKSENTECDALCGASMPADCPHSKNMPVQSYAGFSISVILAAFGTFMILSSKKYSEEISQKEKKIERLLSTVNGEEKKVCDAITESKGAIFQSDLVEKTGFPKVKVSRILDKLEGRGIIDRRRRGMTNLVLFKSE